MVKHNSTQKKKLQGHCNSPLTEKGITQAERAGMTLKNHLKNRKFQVYSSSLGRAVHTATIVCEKMGYSTSKLIQDSRLKEFSLGDWEEKPLSRLIEQHPDLLSDRDWYLKAPQSESYNCVQSRLISWLSEVPESDIPYFPK